MQFYLRATHASRVQKPAATRRPSAASPFAAASKTKPSVKRDALAKELEDDSIPGERLSQTGKIYSTITVDGVKDVLSALEHITTSMFDQLPDRAGMNSTRIAEVLNFQKNLPPIVTLAHVHALISASSKVEREIASLLASNQIRKLKIVGRGNDISGISEVLITTRQLEHMLRTSSISTSAVRSFLDTLARSPRTVSLPANALPPAHTKELLNAGFLVSSSLSAPSNSRSSSHNVTTPSSLTAPTTVSRAPAGTLAAVGGPASFEALGGVGSASTPTTFTPTTGQTFHLSLPRLGTALRLLAQTRTHLLSLLSRSPHRETPLYLLRERWDGAVDTESRSSVAKRVRGEFSGVPPAKTKKWKDLRGVRFEWALEEALGAGLVEGFETGSVGWGIRVL